MENTIENLDFFTLSKLEQDSLIEMFELQKKYEGLSDGDFPTSRIRRGNPYNKCNSCGISIPEISNRGHSIMCEWYEAYKRYTFLYGFLNESAKSNIQKYFELLEE